MYLRDLIDFLDNKKNASEFLDLIRPEVQDYLERRQAEKTSLSFYLDAEGAKRTLNTADLVALFQKYLGKHILEWEVDYILNTLEVMELEDGKLEEVITSFSDPHLNYSITPENIQRAVSYLLGKTKSLDIPVSKPKLDRTQYKSRVLNGK